MAVLALACEVTMVAGLWAIVDVTGDRIRWLHGPTSLESILGLLPNFDENT